MELGTQQSKRTKKKKQFPKGRSSPRSKPMLNVSVNEFGYDVAEPN
jgi:hypothetical protein